MAGIPARLPQGGNECEFVDHSIRNDKRVQILTPHASVDLIQCDGQGYPGVQNDVMECSGFLWCWSGKPEFVCGLQRVFDMEIVCECLREIFIRVHGRILGNVLRFPSVWSAFGIVAVELVPVASGIVAENFPGFLRAFLITENERAFEVVPYFVPEMAEHSPVRFIELRPHLLAVRVITFGQIDGDQTVFMTDDHVGVDAGKQVKGQSKTRILGTGDNRQAQRIQFSN